MTKIIQLDATLAALDDLLQTVAWPTGLLESRVDLFVATTAMSVRASELAKGIALLARFNAAHLGGAVLLRGLLEVSTELSLLVRSSDAERNSSKGILHGALQLLQFFESAPPSEASAEGAKRMRDLLNARRTWQLDVVDEVIADRRKRRFHWSGIGYGAISREVTGTAVIYQALSWEVHAATAALQSFRTTRDEDGGGFLQFGGSAMAFLNNETIADMTEAMTTKTWNEYASVWGFRELPLQLPK
jgi:hypothetical protein